MDVKAGWCLGCTHPPPPKKKREAPLVSRRSRTQADEQPCTEGEACHTCVRTHSCTRTMHARADTQACVAHVKHMCPPNPHTAVFHYSSVSETWRNTSLIHMHLLLQSFCNKRKRRGQHSRRPSYFLKTGESESVHAAFSNFKVAWSRPNQRQIVHCENWVSMSLADTVSVKRGALDGALCAFKTAVVFSQRRFGILGSDESSGARPGETASAWGAQAVGVAMVLPISVFFGLTHRWEGQHFIRRRISHSFFNHSLFILFVCLKIHTCSIFISA